MEAEHFVRIANDEPTNLLVPALPACRILHRPYYGSGFVSRFLLSLGGEAVQTHFLIELALN